MAKYAVSGWNEIVVDDSTEIHDEVSKFFSNKKQAEAFLSSLTVGFKHLEVFGSQCGCLSNGDDCEPWGDVVYCLMCI
jgi:uncharacterized protein YfcZ (UPF0381/DUF406 family)